jgi:hypothetical protein
MSSKKERLFDRSSLSQRTMSVFQIIGAYFVDIYYNHLYVEATKFKKEGKVTSITEGYRHATYAFLSGIDSKAKVYKLTHYNTLLKGINEYFQLWTSFSTLSLSDCISKIVREFVPEDYFSNVDKDVCRNLLRVIIVNILRTFTKVVIDEFLTAIIDNHDEMANIEAMKDRIIDIFIAERHTLYHKFLLANDKSDEFIDKRFAEKMRAEIEKLQKEKETMNSQLKKQKEEIDVRTEQLSKVLVKYRKIEHEYKLMSNEYKAIKQKLEQLSSYNLVDDRPVYNTKNTHESNISSRDKVDDSEIEHSIHISTLVDNSKRIKEVEVEPMIEDDDTSVEEMDELILSHTKEVHDVSKEVHDVSKEVPKPTKPEPIKPEPIKLQLKTPPSLKDTNDTKPKVEVKVEPKKIIKPKIETKPKVEPKKIIKPQKKIESSESESESESSESEEQVNDKILSVKAIDKPKLGSSPKITDIGNGSISDY